VQILVAPMLDALMMALRPLPPPTGALRRLRRGGALEPGVEIRGVGHSAPALHHSPGSGHCRAPRHRVTM